MMHVPKEVSYAASSMTVTRNSFTLETAGATSAAATNVVTIHLPEGASHVDLRSFAVFFQVQTFPGEVADNGGSTVQAKVARVEDLIQSIEVYIGGTQVTQISDYNSVCRMYKIPCVSRDFAESVAATLSGERIDNTELVAQNRSLCLHLGGLPGLFGESSVRYINTALTGAISVRLVMASNSVLVYKQTVVAGANGAGDIINVGADFAGGVGGVDGRNAAALARYSVSEIRATIDTLNFGPEMDRMLMERLSQEQFLPVNFMHYETFNDLNFNGDHVSRFTLSSSSVETVLAGLRRSNFADPGIKSRQMSGVTLTENIVPNAFSFLTFKSDLFVSPQSVKNAANIPMTVQFSANGIKHPQYPMTALNACHHLALMDNKLAKYSSGNMITSLGHFQTGCAVFPLVLCLPGEPLHVRTGYDSRGANTSFEVEFRNITPIAPNNGTQDTGFMSAFIAGQTKRQLRIAANRQVAYDA